MENKKVQHNWDHFDEGPRRRRADGFHVTINAAGHIFMSRATHAAFGSPEMAELLYDTRRKVIGVKPAAPTSRTAFRIVEKYPLIGGGRALYVKNFFRYYQIKFKETYLCTTVRVDDEGILLVGLHDLVPIRKKRS